MTLKTHWRCVFLSRSPIPITLTELMNMEHSLIWNAFVACHVPRGFNSFQLHLSCYLTNLRRRSIVQWTSISNNRKETLPRRKTRMQSDHCSSISKLLNFNPWAHTNYFDFHMRVYVFPLSILDFQVILISYADWPSYWRATWIIE